MTMAEFLNARLDENESDARGMLAHSAAARAHGLTSTLLDEEDRNAQRTLREVAADRAFLALVPWDLETLEFMDTVLRIRVTIWSDHPDYQPGWAS